LNTKYESQLAVIDQRINKIYYALNPNAELTADDDSEIFDREKTEGER
jgi:hypothetical protein